MMFDQTGADRVFEEAFANDRRSLLEFESYRLLERSGMGKFRQYDVITDPNSVTDETLAAFPGEKVVLKVVSPVISHKTDVGGVRIVKKETNLVRSTITDMMNTIPGAYVDWLQKAPVARPEKYQDLTNIQLQQACRNDIQGILMTDFIVPDREEFGYEMLVGLRWDREFGPVLTLGIGGVDTELMARSMKPGLSAVTGSAVENSPEELLEIFKSTIAYRKIAGLTRGGTAVVDDEVILRNIRAILNLARVYGPDGDSEFCISEFEINPLVFCDHRMVPLDGLCNFHRRSETPPASPTHKITKLLHPRSMAIIGVSAKKMNMGRIILKNVIKNDFDINNLFVIRPGLDRIDDVKCVPDLAELPQKVDVLVLAVDASQAPEIIQNAAESGKVESVIIIPGGLGEKSGTEAIVAGMNDAIRNSRNREDNGPIFVGGNCLGILSRPGNYDTLFVPEEKLPKNYDKSPDPVAFLSQSGARMITVMSVHTNISPMFAISTGNQMDLGISDFLDHMADHETGVRVFAVYVEGFKDLGGIKMVRTVKKLVSQGKDVIFYKAGRTEEGKSATSGHTASVAGSYSVCAGLLQDAGAMVCNSFTEFNELTRLAVALGTKTFSGNRLAGISNAGYETVGIADNIDGPFGFNLATYAPETRNRLQDILVTGRINTLVDVRNPMDVTPMANDDTHCAIIRAQLDDPGVDCILAATVPLSPAQQTLPAGVFGREDITNENSYPHQLIRVAKSSDKPVVVVIDSGEIYDPMVDMMTRAGLPVFRTADLAIRMFGKYAANRLKR